LSLAREEIDNPHKKKAQKVFRENFSIQMTFEKVSKPTGYENEHNTKSAAKIVENGEKKNGVDPLKEGLERVVDTNIDIKIEDAS